MSEMTTGSAPASPAGQPAGKGVNSQDLYEMAWNARWKAHVNVRYFIRLGRIYQKIERGSSLLTAISASAAVVKWSVWTSLPGVLETYTAVTALISIANSVFQWQNQVRTIADLQKKWADQQVHYDLIWVRIRSGEDVSLEEIKTLRMHESEWQSLEGQLWAFSSLIEQAQNEVCDAWKIPRRAIN